MNLITSTVIAVDSGSLKQDELVVSMSWGNYYDSSVTYTTSLTAVFVVAVVITTTVRIFRHPSATTTIHPTVTIRWDVGHIYIYSSTDDTLENVPTIVLKKYQ